MANQRKTVYAVNGTVPYRGEVADEYETDRGPCVLVYSCWYQHLEHDATDVYPTAEQAVYAAKQVCQRTIERMQQRLAKLESEGVDAVIR